MDKELHAIRLKFRGPVHFGSKKLDYGQSETQLRSDTIYSAIFQAWALIGQENLIPKEESNELNFTLSSAFPFYYNGEKHEYFFPKPFGSLFKRDNSNDFIEHRKALKKIAYLHKEAFYDWCKNGEIALDTTQLKGLFYAQDLPKERLFYSELSPRVKVARKEGEDATPFGLDRLYFYENEKKHAGLFFLFYGNQNELKKVKIALDILEDEGFGTDRKVGNGQFQYSIEKFEQPDWDGDTSINLSLFLPESSSWLKEKILTQNNGGYSLIERGGWISSQPLGTYRKNTLHFFEEGSLFNEKVSKIKELGTIKDVYPTESLDFVTKPHPVWRVGKALLFPVNT